MGGDALSLLLDTHAWIWWNAQPARLSKRARRVIDALTDDGETALVSAISCWEAAKLVERGRLGLSVAVKDWIDLALGRPGVALVPLSPTIAVASTQLPRPFHDDPADQIIVATARDLDVSIVTRDARLRSYPHVRTVW